ncbi:MAG: ParA family protein [Dehalococcoidia bacterium]|nr:ParA family protein [Dehalococcoidia bacterium]
MSAQVVTFVNQKGGVGKTTSAVSLSAALARRGHRVLLIDLDPQSNATSAVGVDGEESPGIYDALIEEADISSCITRVESEGFDLVPSSRALSGAEVELVPAMARERRLSAAIHGAMDDYEFIFIDCPPSLGLLTINALTASHYVIIPVQCEYMALEGLTRLTETLDLVRRNLNSSLTVLGVLLTMYDVRTRLSQQVADEVREHFARTFDTVVPRAVRLSEAPSHGQSIFMYEPGGRSATAYDDLAGELLERVGVAV